ncbi:CYTH domain-containing protein [Microbacterium radiodurans]|uniref:CYTH domain-containing protein n=1 Tax=Microbacterium radiodurans TaxID=661398 RepID=A0A5J5IRX6_9MICO|nr:CYTH domain-containing protein [Microbacterium radiodurans]KAA9087199.1 CYTH domain-containing protein [Microbacterium radiodurans]
MTTEPTSSLEIERKYDVDAAAPLPVLAALPGVAGIGDAEIRELDARYFDTADGLLAAARTALRRRTGGPDAGWHVKRSTPEGKHETRWPLDEADDLGTAAVPAAVAAEVAAVAAPPFEVIARIRNARVAYALHDAAGDLVAEFVDDRVSARDERTGRESSWREWELELGPAGPGDPDAITAFFAAADELVHAAGGRVAASESKLGRALGR